MGIVKTILLACESIYSLNINDNIEYTVTNFSKCSCRTKSWVMRSLAIRGKQSDQHIYAQQLKVHMHCKYLSKFPILMLTQGLSADHQIKSCKIVFAEYGLPKKIMSDAEDLSCYVIIIQPPKQWVGRNMHTIHKTNYEDMFQN